VYVDAETGEVEPKNVADRYVDIISVFNATHKIGEDEDELELIEEIEPVTKPVDVPAKTTKKVETRASEIDAAKNKHFITRNASVQEAANNIIYLGYWMLASGIIGTIIGVFLLFAAAFTEGSTFFYAVICLILGILQIVFGQQMSKLEETPSNIRGYAIFGIIAGGAGIVTRIGILVYAIIVLMKLKEYEDWYYKRTK
jgi:hypothetical protein